MDQSPESKCTLFRVSDATFQLDAQKWQERIHAYHMTDSLNLKSFHPIISATAGRNISSKYLLALRQFMSSKRASLL